MSSSHKWVKDLRGLASSPNDNDHLKIDYIDVNLNNSRKLIANVNTIVASSEQYLLVNHSVNESLIKLQSASQALKWTDGEKRS
ncbi:hypothetical protein PSN45_002751 [Yamadazyma tenuis]|nr:hypothetical protein PSN45_002751 [Yamadazyma tenuis]